MLAAETLLASAAGQAPPVSAGAPIAGPAAAATTAVAPPAPLQVAASARSDISNPADPGGASSVSPGGDGAAPSTVSAAAAVQPSPRSDPAGSPLPVAVLPQPLPPVPLDTTDSGFASFGGGVRNRQEQAVAGSPGAAAVPVAAASGYAGDTNPLIAPTAAPPAGADAASPVAVADQVAAHLVRLVSSGSRDMVLRLRPPELGDVTVRVAVAGRDVSAWFASPQPQVQDAISAALGQLHSSLGDAGYNLNGAWVGSDGASPQQQRPSPPPPGPSARAFAASAIAPPLAAAPRAAASGLNVYV